MKTAVIVGIIAVILVLGITAYMMMNTANQNPTAPNAQNEQAASEQQLSDQGYTSLTTDDDTLSALDDSFNALS